MRVRLKNASAAVLVALPALAHAVSLSEWTPRAVGLPPACQAIYTAPIPGCNVQDFESGRCSTACIQSLEALEAPVKRACAGKGVTGRNLIVAFLANVGPQQICPNAPVASPVWPSHPPPPGQSPATHSSSQWLATRSTSSWSGTTTASSLSPGDSSSLVVDTSRTSNHDAVSPQTKSTSPSSTHTSSAPSQVNTGDHSGGGSPFDTMGNLGSGGVRLSFSAVVALLSAAVAAVFALR